MVKKVRSVLKERTEQRLIYEDKPMKVKKVRMVTAKQLVTKKVPVVRGSVTGCSCFVQDCQCLDKEGCECCQPVCQCAPSIEYEMVEVVNEIKVPEEYFKTIMVKQPKLIDVPYTVTEPEEYEEKVIERVPVITEVTREVSVPVTVLVDVEEEVPVETIVEFTEEVPTEIEEEKEI